MAQLALTPTVTASLARDVYALTKLPTIDLALKSLNRDYGDYFAFTNDNLLKGRTGGPSLIKCRTAFGFCLIGKGGYKGHAFILFRGTQYLADWFTNLNITLARSSFQQPVHDGFHKAFQSMRPSLQEFVSQFKVNGITHVHCIGHSLGGALATLCGEWLKATYGINPGVYSYGSPRVGLKGFAHECSKKIGCDNIYRAYHKTDIVPCIPIWPFVHTPDVGHGYYLPSPGVIPGAEYHSMVHYVDSVSGKSWKALAALKPEKKSESSVKRWLKEETPLRGTITTLEWLNDALLFVLKKCVSGAEWIISASMGTALTITDQLAYILHRGINLAEDLSSWVLYLMKKIMRFLGYGTQVDAAEMTHSFIKAILMQLNQKLHMIAKTALSNALVDGRAI